MGIGAIAVGGAGYSGYRTGNSASKNPETRNGIQSHELPEALGLTAAMGALGAGIGFLGAAIPNASNLASKPPWGLGVAVGGAIGLAYGAGWGLSEAAATTSVKGAHPMPGVGHPTLESAADHAEKLSNGSQPAIVVSEQDISGQFTLNSSLRYDAAAKYNGNPSAPGLMDLVAADPQARMIVDGDVRIPVPGR